MQWISHRTVQDQLDCSDRTLRNYCRLLEKYEYEFERDPHGKRLFSEDNLSHLKEMLALKEQGLTFEDAASQVVARHRQRGEESNPQASLEIENSSLIQFIEKVDHLINDPQLSLEFYRNPAPTLERLRSHWESLKAAVTTSDSK